MKQQKTGIELNAGVSEMLENFKSSVILTTNVAVASVDSRM